MDGITFKSKRLLKIFDDCRGTLLWDSTVLSLIRCTLFGFFVWVIFIGYWKIS